MTLFFEITVGLYLRLLFMKKLFPFLFTLLSFVVKAQDVSEYIQNNYNKMERMITMRDGVKLFTAIYYPKDTTIAYPILINRTPYSCSPYGENSYRSKLGPDDNFAKEKYIFVYQDVRGRYMSEGQFQEMTPAIDNKKSNKDVDESSDMYDTVDWLLKNTHNNGNVGVYGISYPGFYASACLPNAHPAIKAVSPQAPVTDEFEGDDAYHRGAFFLMDNFEFLNYFDYPRPAPWQSYPRITEFLSVGDAYYFFNQIGPIKNINYFYLHDSSKIWNEYLQHATKDAYWQERNIRPHLKNIKPAVLVVGGWFDAEDMFGALKTYEAIEKQTPGNDNRLVMGPWSHGAWARDSWSSFGTYNFGGNVNEKFHQMQFDFFNHYLKNKNNFKAPEATIFFTGINQWKTFEHWPSRRAKKSEWLFGENHQLSLTRKKSTGCDEYESDPNNPVPYINQQADGRVNEYMTADQTFASQRKDVLYYVSNELKENITLAGPITANLFVSTTGTDADFVVKVIDVLPDGEHTQRLVRAEVLRGKFRKSFVTPEPFTPGKITRVRFHLNDVAHTFLKGHKIMVQIQSSWFPLVDMNPQQFMDIPQANASDFKKETVTIYHDEKHPSRIEVHELK